VKITFRVIYPITRKGSVLEEWRQSGGGFSEEVISAVVFRTVAEVWQDFWRVKRRRALSTQGFCKEVGNPGALWLGPGGSVDATISDLLLTSRGRRLLIDCGHS